MWLKERLETGLDKRGERYHKRRVCLTGRFVFFNQSGTVIAPVAMVGAETFLSVVVVHDFTFSKFAALQQARLITQIVFEKRMARWWVKGREG